MKPRIPGQNFFVVATVTVLFAGSIFTALPRAGANPPDRPLSFRNDVMAVLSKAGCNAGSCHGNANGKAGFKLSLRGQDPDLDHRALTRDMFGRRTNPLDPDQSLILLKATAEVAHEGGQRFGVSSDEYQILRTWIGTGARDDSADAAKVERLEVTPREQIVIEPAAEVQLTAHAVFSDGTRRDVSSLAVYDPANQLATVSHDGLVEQRGLGEVTVLVRYLQHQVPVRVAFVPARKDFVWLDVPPANFVDEHVLAKLRALRINPSALSSDNEFVRRAYLDLLGVLPTAAEAREFVADSHPEKRTYLVDRLLERPEFADFWALKWSDLLRNEEKVLDRKGVQSFHHWIRQSIATNLPMDQFARELVAGRGSSYGRPAANFYRANRDAVTRAEATAQLFLGVRLGCAKCHNHPFDRWTQTDYYDWADLFARVNYKILKNERRDSNDQHEFVGEQVVYSSRAGAVTNPKTGRPAAARFLGVSGDTPSNEESLRAPAGGDRLDALAVWITSPDNPHFAPVQVNRVFYHLLGRGIVDPIDDFRPTNPPSIPALLDALAADFVAHDFNLRHLIRVIMTSRTYQLSAEPNDTNREDEANFSHALVRRLSAEQLLDAQNEVVGVPAQFNGYPVGMRATQVPGVRAVRVRRQKPSADDMFLEVFGKPPRLLTCECERSAETSLAQTFNLISGPVINDLLTTADNRLDKLLAGEKSDAEILDELYWTALSRTPKAQELERGLQHLATAKNRRAALEDLTWALLNAKEFVLRR